MKKSLLALTVVALWGSSAHATMDVDVVLNGALMKTTSIKNSGFAVGFGGLIGFGLSPDMVFETGLIWNPRSANVDASSTANLQTNFKYLKVPAMLRFKVLPMLTLGAGIYAAKGIGDVNLKANVSGTVAQAAFSYSDLGISSMDYGAILGAGFKLPMALYHFTFNAGYLLGMKDFDPSGFDDKWTGFELQAGVGMEF